MLTTTQEHDLIDLAHQFITKIREQFNKDALHHNIDITFDLHGTTWGMYVKQQQQQCLRFNPTLCAAFYKQCNEVVAHEVAHFAVDQLYRASWRAIKPHGKEWRQIMSLLGFSDARASYQADTSQLALKRQRRFLYQCQCQTHELSTTRHNRIRKQQAVYRCPQCLQPLVPVEPS